MSLLLFCYYYDYNVNDIQQDENRIIQIRERPTQICGRRYNRMLENRERNLKEEEYFIAYLNNKISFL